MATYAENPLPAARQQAAIEMQKKLYSLLESTLVAFDAGVGQTDPRLMGLGTSLIVNFAGEECFQYKTTENETFPTCFYATLMIAGRADDGDYRYDAVLEICPDLKKAEVLSVIQFLDNEDNETLAIQTYDDYKSASRTRSELGRKYLPSQEAYVADWIIYRALIKQLEYTIVEGTPRQQKRAQKALK